MVHDGTPDIQILYHICLSHSLKLTNRNQFTTYNIIIQSKTYTYRAIESTKVSGSNIQNQYKSSTEIPLKCYITPVTNTDNNFVTAKSVSKLNKITFVFNEFVLMNVNFIFE